MKIAMFTDTFYPEMNGVARTLKRLTDYMNTQQISCKFLHLIHMRTIMPQTISTVTKAFLSSYILNAV